MGNETLYKGTSPTAARLCLIVLAMVKYSWALVQDNETINTP